MYVRIAFIFLIVAICNASPQHGYGNIGNAGYGGVGGYGGIGGGYGSGGAFSTVGGYRAYGGNAGGYGGYGGYGGQAIGIAHAVAPVVAKVAAVPAIAKVAAVPVDHYAPPHYQFEYAVNDAHTGDIKSQHEEREGDHTRGYYSLHEPDGTVRTVHYTVDPHSGFNAVVERTGHAAHPQRVHHAVIPVQKHY